MKNVYYPLAGMNYIIDNLSQILKNKKPEEREAIIIYLSAQVNSYPHVGTLINFTSAFAIAKQLKETYKVPVRIRVELLESVTGEEGFERLYNEVNLWVSDPKLFIRDYTIEYIDMVLRGEAHN